jgi:thermosome subunit
MAAKVITEILQTSLGPRGMDKLLIDAFGDVTITGDGATILKEMEVQHPAAKLLVEVAKAQDAEVGDGTTTVVVLAGKLLEQAEMLLDEGIHPTIIIDGFKKALDFINSTIPDIPNLVSPVNLNNRDEVAKIVANSLSSKVVSEARDYLAKITVDASYTAAEQANGKYSLDLDWVKVEKKKARASTRPSSYKALCWIRRLSTQACRRGL